MRMVEEACEDTEDVQARLIVDEALRSLYDGIPETEVGTALTMSARTLIEQEPSYTYVAARLLLDSLRREVLSFIYGVPAEATFKEMSLQYADYFEHYIRKVTELGLLDTKLATEYDLKKLGKAIKPERDHQFTYLGMQTLYDRYFIQSDGTRVELPQVFFMRVAMGLAMNEVDREDRTIEFYNLLSSFDFMSSTCLLYTSPSPRDS